MSTSRPLNSDKPENIGTTIGFRFYANDEELEEVSAKNNDAKQVEDNSKLTTDVTTQESPDGAKAVGDNISTIADTVREQRSLLGKRSISVDSAYESAFANPIETWKKLNVLKEKITKTVEEKIFDRNVLSKTSRSRLSHSKENSSISDSEDTSESSKMSDQWKNTENQIPSLEKTTMESLETHLNTSNSCPDDVKIGTSETENKENESELRNRKGFTNFSELINVPDIKIATAKSDAEGNALDENMTDIESGVEADENLETNEGSLDLDGITMISRDRGGSSDPPFGGNNNFLNALSFSKSVIISQTSTIVILLGFTLYLFFPLSEFLRGFLLSFLLITFWGSVKSYVQLDDSSQQQRPFVIPNYEAMPPLRVPENKPAKGIWFNEYEKEVYDPDYYTVTQTVPAYLELEDSILKVSRPKGKIHRRATYDEPEYKLPFISQRIYNISGCNVYLMPDGLTRKRLFSKKYPIVIFLRPDSLISEKKHGKDIDEKGTPEDGETDEHYGYSTISPESPKNKCTLYLFARCDRQKEEWYRKLLSATRYCQKSEVETAEDTDNETEKMPLDDSPNKEPCTPFENVFFDDDVALIEEYFRYMANFVHVEIYHNIEVPSKPSHRKLKNKKKDAPRPEEIGDRHLKNVTPSSVHKKSKSSRNSVQLEGSDVKENEINYSGDQVQWFNAFVNRILFDVFRSPYWHSKIQEKVHRKLNSIRLPYYIEDIEVVEMDLGKTGPVFHRVSQPYMDERGLWFDMDLTFDGFIRLTIQTHLNLIKLQKGMEENEEIRTHANEKPKKGKKNQRIERESKDSVFSKESKENRKGFLSRKIKKMSKTSTPIPPVVLERTAPSSHEDIYEEPNLEPQTSNEFRHKLIDEVAQFAEIAVEESLPPVQEEGSNLDVVDCPRSEPSKNRSPIYDSELEDSAESSDEDEEEEESLPSQAPPVSEEQPTTPNSRRYPKSRRSSKKIFKVFENVAQSKYFRSMAQSRYIQKAIAGVSAARLRLTLEIKSCTGILAVNIPPPPSDRFWYGFREMPKLVFSANPKIGDKTVRFVHIRNYLQKKILHELKAKMVQPNMIAVLCPMMVREAVSPIFVNVPRFPVPSGNKLMVIPNMIDFVLPTSAPARSPSSLQIEEPDQQETTLSE